MHVILQIGKDNDFNNSVRWTSGSVVKVKDSSQCRQKFKSTTNAKVYFSIEYIHKG